MSVHRYPAMLVSMVLLLSPFAAAQQSTGESSPTPRFKSSIDVVTVSAVVRDRKGRFVSDLERNDFTVLEGSQSRPIIDFRAESDGPVKVAVLFDVSGSMRLGRKAVDARQAAQHVFSALRPTDEAAVYSFDSRLDRVTDFTSDVKTLEASLDRVNPPYGQTSLYDAIAQTARAVADAGRGSGSLPQRSAVVVLTDGVDTRSLLTPEQVSGIASVIDVPVYVIAVMSTIDDPRDATTVRAMEVSSALRNLSQWTGGDLFTASAPAHASVAARQIVDELRHQYVLAFESSPRRGWHPLRVVSARNRDLKVRARAGYNAGGNDAAKFEG